MTLPHHLQQLIAECLAYVGRNPQHTLNLGRRELIAASFGPYRYAEGNSDDTGRIRRIALALLAIEHVAQLWERAWPDNTTLQELLAKIRHVQRAPAPRPEELEADCERYWQYVTELTDATRNIAGAVGMAAASAYGLAICDDFMTDDEPAIERGDGDDFMYHDVHFYAASAYANGPPYPIALSDRFDPQRSAAFWAWWLTQAVPAAWAAAPFTDGAADAYRRA